MLAEPTQLNHVGFDAIFFFACLKGSGAGAAGVRMPGRRRKIHHFHNPDCSRRPYFLPVSFVFVLSLLLPGGLQCFCELEVLLVVFLPAFWMINDACESMKSSVFYVLYRYMYYFSLPFQVPASYERSWCQEGPTLGPAKPCG